MAESKASLSRRQDTAATTLRERFHAHAFTGHISKISLLPITSAMMVLLLRSLEIFAVMATRFPSFR